MAQLSLVELARSNRPVSLGILLAAILFAVRLLKGQKKPPSKKSSSSRGSSSSSSSSSTKKKIQVDGTFLRRLIRLLRICIPRAICPETMMFAILSVLLVLRTRLTVIIADVIGNNAKHLVNRELWKFISGVVSIGLWALPSSVVNSGIQYTTSQLEQRFRHNLQLAFHKEYLSSFTVYKIASKKDDIDNPDHRLTQDMLQFCTEVTALFPSVFKPIVDVVTFVYQLSKYGGVVPPALMIAYYIVAGFLLRAIMPNYAKLTAKTQQKEGDFRAVHAQIIQHAEEVAFYRGESIERHNADGYIDSLVRHQLHLKKMKSFTDFFDAVLIKYGATCIGYAVCSIGVFQLKGKVDTSELTRVYIRSSQLYIPLARAIGKIVMLHKRVTALAGYTSRVAELKEVFDALRARDGGRHIPRSITEVPRGDEIALDNVTIAAPSGSELVKNLSFTVQRQKHLLIMGNNGSGKSALMRIIAGLWPAAEGSIVRPPMAEIAFLPQRTYLPAGNLRQQLIFPDTEEEARKKNIDDVEIMKMVEDVGLTKVVEREGGLDARKEWHDVLSGGERQRVALIRVLYGRPAFALLDECTSAVSQDVEPDLYLQVKRRGVTLITVSHRESLRQHHDALLTLDGFGNYELSSLKGE